MNNRLFYSDQSPQITKEDSKDIPIESSKKSKIDFKQKKEKTLKSLNEVEYFLCDLKNFKRYLHLYKFFK